MDLRRWKSNSICKTSKLWNVQHRNKKDMPSTSDVCVCEREKDRQTDDRQTEVGDCAKGRDSKDKMRGERRMQWRSQFSLGKSKGLFEDIKSH